MTNDEITTILEKYDIKDENLSKALTEIANVVIERAGSINSDKALEIERQIIQNQKFRARHLAGYQL